MSPQQAIQFIDQALQQVTATRQVHAQLTQALQVLGELVATSMKEVKK